jgi:hypothetical protein
MSGYQIYKNSDVNLGADDLYELVREKENTKRHHVHYVDGEPQDDSQYFEVTPLPREKKQGESSVKKILWTIVLLVIAGVLLYLTVYRMGVAGKSLYKGNTLTGLALLSPEIGTVVRMGLGF